MNPPVAPTLPAPPYRRLVRVPDARMLGGVATALAHYTGVTPWTMRWIFLAACVVNGAGLMAYVLWWALTPVSEDGGEEAPGIGWVDQARDAVPQWWGQRSRQLGPRGKLLVAAAASLGLILTAVAVLGTGGSWGQMMLPLLLIVAGAVLAWSPIPHIEASADGRRWSFSSVARVVVGALLVVAGVLSLLLREQPLAWIWLVVVASLGVVLGTGVAVAPWAGMLWQRYTSEQRDRIRAQERADIAAHLHDSVLQTLALIQRSTNPTQGAQLARAQERELRQWLYGQLHPDAEKRVAAALTSTCEELEDAHGVPVEVVTTGDAELTDAGASLVAATREAVSNAVRHGAPPIRVYAELTAQRGEVFVRDHGPGFDLDALASVDADRLGVRESILGRCERRGGHARFRRRDPGCEVELCIPLAVAPSPDTASADTQLAEASATDPGSFAPSSEDPA